MTKQIALTYDDGPGPETAELVSFLVAEGVPATFFLIGETCLSRPDEARLMATSPGIEVATHTHTHPDLNALDEAGVREELSRSLEAVEQVTGVRARYFRPPMGHRDKRVDRIAAALGQSLILWTLNSFDWRDPKHAGERVVRGARPGDIVLLHDTRPHTVTTTRFIVTELKRQGYKFTSVADIVGATAPGTVHRGATAKRTLVKRWATGAARTGKLRFRALTRRSTR